MSKFPQEGEIWLVKFEKLKESRKPYRPCLVISDNIQNEFDESIVVVPITTDNLENIKLVEVYIENSKANGLDHPSKIQVNYPFTFDKELRLIDKKRLGIVSQEIMEQVWMAWKIAFGRKK